jgi:hypothetical protein
MPTPESILKAIAWPKNIDYSLENLLIEKGSLMFDRLGGQKKEFIYLTREAAVDKYKTAESTTHWYRGMPKEEFDELFKWNIIKDSDDAYTGIAPNREYVKKGFFSNNSTGTHIVEFGSTVNINFDEDFSIYRQFHSLGFSLKAEGGGTFGLGGKGATSAALNQVVRVYGTEAGRKKAKLASDDEKIREKLREMKSPSDLFTEWLTSGKIYRKLVDLRLDAKGNAESILASN